MTEFSDGDIDGLRGNSGMFETGERIAENYEVLELLGQGGQGEVYRVKNDADGQEYVAKIFTGGDANVEFEYERFVFGLLRRLPICDFLVHAHPAAKHMGREVLILEHVPGELLGDKLRSGKKPLPFRDALAITRQILRGLAVLHEAGVVHRDVKPDNVKIARRGAVLFDFGIAAKVEDRNAPDARTHGFSPPEREITPAWDVYSVGVLLHLLVTGRMPLWEKGRERPLCDDRLVLLKEFDCKPWLKSFFRKALAFRAEDRFADANAMLNALSFRYRLPLALRAGFTSMKRHPVRSVLLFLLLAATAALPIGVFFQLTRTHESEQSRARKIFEVQLAGKEADIRDLEDRLAELLSLEERRARDDFLELLSNYRINLRAGKVVCSRFWAERQERYRGETWSEEAKGRLSSLISEEQEKIEKAETLASHEAGRTLVINELRIQGPIPGAQEEVWVFLTVSGSASGTADEHLFRAVKEEGSQLFIWSEKSGYRVEGCLSGARFYLSIKDRDPSLKDRVPFIDRLPGGGPPQALLPAKKGRLGILQPLSHPWESGGWIRWENEGVQLRVEGTFL